MEDDISTDEGMDSDMPPALILEGSDLDSGSDEDSDDSDDDMTGHIPPIEITEVKDNMIEDATPAPSKSPATSSPREKKSPTLDVKVKEPALGTIINKKDVAVKKPDHKAEKKAKSEQVKEAVKAAAKAKAEVAAGKKAPEPKKAAEPVATPKPVGPVMKGTKGGVTFEILKVGSDKKVATRGKKVEIQYIGSLAKTGKTFDKGTFSFNVGAREVVAGFDIGVEGECTYQ